MIKTKLVIFSVLFLSACAAQPLKVDSIALDKPKLTVIEPQQPVLAPVEFKAITWNNYPFYGLTQEYLINLRDNLANLKAYTDQQSAEIQAYKNYYEPEVKAKN